MVDIVLGVLEESFNLYLQMSPYLLFGFVVAGILHAFISLEWVAKHLSKKSLSSVFKAVVLGIPLPLCSCGVIPAAILLKKKGASKASVISFLIATPITGVDSIFATYSLLGPVFALYRVVSSALTALVAGVLANWWIPHYHHTHHEGELPQGHCAACATEAPQGEHAARGGLTGRFVEDVHYVLHEILGDIWKWLLLGVLIGGAIEYAVPDVLIQRYLGVGWQAMLVMLVVGIPMYVCSTGSIPIAAALMMKGMSPGAGLVFLLAGPATNAITITVVARELGRAAATLYVLSIAVMSIVMGMLLNALWGYLNIAMPSALIPMQMVPMWVEWGSMVVLTALILYVAVRGAVKHTKI